MPDRSLAEIATDIGRAVADRAEPDWTRAIWRATLSELSRSQIITFELAAGERPTPDGFPDHTDVFAKELRPGPGAGPAAHRHR